MNKLTYCLSIGAVIVSCGSASAAPTFCYPGQNPMNGKCVQTQCPRGLTYYPYQLPYYTRGIPAGTPANCKCLGPQPQSVITAYYQASLGRCNYLQWEAAP